MTIKRNHHIIPKLYLKEFADSSRPDDFPENKPYTPAFWKIDKLLESSPVRKSPEKSFGKNRFYKLSNDTDEYQIIEETLNKVETNYCETLKKLKDKMPLVTKDLLNLIVFVETLHYRIESQIEYWRNKFNEIENIYREVDQSYNNSQKFSDEFWEGSHEISKKLIITGIGAIGKRLTNEGIYILFNESDMPFISSDNPVLWTHGHIDEFQMCNIPSEWLKDEIKTNQKHFFCYCPLTPQIAVFSSPFFNFVGEQIYQYWKTKDVEIVFSMNYLTHISANEVIISNKSNPYGDYEGRFKYYLEGTRTPSYKKGKQILFYTSEARYWLKVKEYKRISDDPIKSKIMFWTDDFETLQLIANDKYVKSVHFYENGTIMGGSRELILQEVSFCVEKPSLIVQI